jgi:hypothetical protein
MLELADMERDPEERKRLLSFVVVGGNYAGVEVAGELREFLPAVARRHFPHVPPEEIKIVLVCSTDHILPELGRSPGLIECAERKLAKARVTVLCRCACFATMEAAILGDGRRIPPRIVSCTGMSTVPLLEHATRRTSRVAWLPTATAVGRWIWTGGEPSRRMARRAPLAIWASDYRQAAREQHHSAPRQARSIRFTGLGDAWSSATAMPSPCSRHTDARPLGWAHVHGYLSAVA